MISKEEIESCLELLKLYPNGTHFCVTNQQPGYELNAERLKDMAELALWGLEAKRELEKISRVGWLMHFEDCEQLFWEERECDCGVGPVNTSLQEALAKFPEAK